MRLLLPGRRRDDGIERKSNCHGPEDASWVLVVLLSISHDQGQNMHSFLFIAGQSLVGLSRCRSHSTVACWVS